MVKYSLKSGKDLIEVEHSADESFEDFQAKVFTLTDIPPKNLKVLFKAKMIKDNESLLNIPEGSQLIIMGTKTGKELKQAGQITIETKMEPEFSIPKRYGFQNIGNTCYMNAGLQFLRNVPAFKDLLFRGKLEQTNQQQALVKNLEYILKELEAKDVTPKMFVAMFLQLNNEFQPFGTQQDSDEFTQKVLQSVSSASPEYEKEIKNIFEIEMVDTMTNTQIPEQEPQVSFHSSLKLCCSLGGVQKDMKIGTLLEGIKLSLEGQLEKTSPLDNNNHIYNKVSRFSKLPNYLMVQMIRFFWKAASDLPNAKPVAVKICKAIDFSTKLDLYEFCTPELKVQLQKGRELHELNQKKEQEQYKNEYQDYKKSLGDINRPETRIIEEFKQIWKRKDRYVKEGLETGMYEITGVITHLGNSIESGHYMAWVREDEEEWTKFDDDTVYQQPAEKVLQLRGGQPNLEIAYVLQFRKIFAKPQ